MKGVYLTSAKHDLILSRAPNLWLPVTQLVIALTRLVSAMKFGRQLTKRLQGFDY